MKYLYATLFVLLAVATGLCAALGYNPCIWACTFMLAFCAGGAWAECR